MATVSKTAGVAVLSHQAVIHPDTAKGAAQDVSTKFAATILMYHASVEATANTNPGRFLVQISGSASGNEDWITVYEFAATISTADTEALTATEEIGETVLAVTSTAGFIAADKLYVQDTGVVGNGEFAFCQKIVTNTSINLINGLTNAKDSSDVIWNDADLFTCPLDLMAVGRVRVIFQHEGATGANCHVKALMVTGDSIA